MVELGQYAFEVVTAYAATGVLLGAITATTLIRARRVKRDLERAEAKTRG